METVELVRTYAETFRDLALRLALIPPELVPNRVLRAWENGGLLTPAWSAETPGEVSRLWINVCVHNATVGVLAHALASRIPNQIKLEGWSVGEVTEAALVHDAFKRREQEVVDAAKAEGRDPMQANRAAEAASIPFLVAAGVSDRVAELAGMTGDHGIDRFSNGGGELAGKLVFYADCCVSDKHVTTYQRRFDALLPHFELRGRYAHAQKSYLTLYHMTHREKWDEVVIPVAKTIAKALNFQGDPFAVPLALTPEYLHLPQ